MAKGKKTGGRSEGTPNIDVKSKRAAAWETLEGMGYDPAAISIGVLALTATNTMPCGVCRGTGKTFVDRSSSGRKSGPRQCQSCKGDLLEKIEPKERAKAGEALSKHLFAQLKAVEHSGSVGVNLAEVLRSRYQKGTK